MADDKKKPDKKKPDAKKPDAPASKTGHDAMWELVGFFLAIAILLTAVSNFSIVDYLSTPSSNQVSNQAPQADYSFWTRLFDKSGNLTILPTGNLSLGTNVKDKGLTQVRREPGGSVIGLQQRGEVAKLSDGPITAYGERWWMADYSNTPSGWVNEKDITSDYFLYYVVNFFPILWDYIRTIGWISSALFLLAIVYFGIKELGVPLYDSIQKSESVKPELSVSPLTKTKTPPINLPIGDYVEPAEGNIRWNHVELLLKSHNSSDWRQAIIEADVILENMLDKMGYPGVSIGDKLKNVQDGDFQTIDKAWEAHKVRNRIAHDGGEYKLPYDEVKRVVGLYHDVFKEFYWV